MRSLLLFLLLCVTTAASAQDEAAAPQQGPVNISQDQRLQNIITGAAPVVERKADDNASDKGDADKSKSSSNRRTSEPRRIHKTEIVDVKDLPTFGKDMNDFDVRTGARKRLRGFRVQMFWGNTQRTDQLKAKRMGDKVTGAFPELKAYVTFQQPHWRCRVGDFKTRAGAAKYLDRLRKIAPEAMIVRSEIIIYQ